MSLDTLLESNDSELDFAFNKLSINNSETNVETNAKKLLTEDTGKMFEMAICLLYDIPYDGEFKYNLEESKLLLPYLTFLKSKFVNLKHTASKGSRYDFTSEKIDSSTINIENPIENPIPLYLSAKTTKKDCKIAPQYIGQVNPITFCERLNIPKMNNTELKKYIQLNIKDILQHFEKNTFDCPIIYYNKNTKIIRYITQISPINWKNMSFIWTKECKNWKNSSTLKIKSSDDTKNISILEIQFHTKRKNMCNRWCFENLLNIFSENFDIEINKSY